MLEAAGEPVAPSKGRSRRRTKKKPEVPAGYRVAEVYFERRGGRSIVGNIYKGVVDNVLPGLEAAFVDIGLDKNGFLHVDEIVLPGVERVQRGRGSGGGKSTSITDLLKPGQEVVVQVVKDPLKTKGARLSMELTIAGRYMVYVPNGEGIGVSRRLEDSERDRLRQEADLSVRVVRDVFSAEFERAVVDDEKQHHRLISFFERTAPELVDRVELWKGPGSLFERAGVEPVIDGLLSRRVDLPSGGYLMIDYGEALTVIDVNSGSFVGRGKTARLEDTITKTNLEAAEAVVNELRLRDIGGVIVIDFLDMARARHRDAVLKKLRELVAEESDGPEAYLVQLNPRVTAQFTGNGSRMLRALEVATGKRFHFEGSEGLPLEHFDITLNGRREEVEERALPFREGEEVLVHIVEPHMYAADDAVAKIDGYIISVANAGSLVGEKRLVRIEEVGRTAATASLVDAPDGPDADRAARSGPGVRVQSPARRRGRRGGRRRSRAGAGANGQSSPDGE